MTRITLGSGARRVFRAAGLVAVGVGATLVLLLLVGRLNLGGGTNRTAPEIVRAIHSIKGDQFCTGETHTKAGKAAWFQNFAGPINSHDRRWRAACFLYPIAGTDATGTLLDCVVVDERTLEVDVGESYRAARDGESPAHFDR